MVRHLVRLLPPDEGNGGDQTERDRATDYRQGDDDDHVGAGDQSMIRSEQEQSDGSVHEHVNIRLGFEVHRRSSISGHHLQVVSLTVHLTEVTADLQNPGQLVHMDRETSSGFVDDIVGYFGVRSGVCVMSSKPGHLVPHRRLVGQVNCVVERVGIVELGGVVVPIIGYYHNAGGR